jgi:hypothetical protein
MGGSWPTCEISEVRLHLAAFEGSAVKFWPQPTALVTQTGPRASRWRHVVPAGSLVTGAGNEPDRQPQVSSDIEEARLDAVKLLKRRA